METPRDAVIDTLAGDAGVPSLTPAEIDAVLALAAAAAHGTGDRTTAPLASFLAGIAAATVPDRVAVLEQARLRVTEVASSPTGHGH